MIWFSQREKVCFSYGDELILDKVDEHFDAGVGFRFLDLDVIPNALSCRYPHDVT